MLEGGSGFDLVVVEGAEKGSVRRLRALQVTLGRRDPSDASTPGRVSFAHPDLPLVQARLVWHDDRSCYAIEQRSPTHPTLVNDAPLTEPVDLKAGDRLTLGSLVLEIRHSVTYTIRTGQFDGPVCLLVLSGADEGRVLHPSQPRTTVTSPDSHAGPAALPVADMGEWQVDLVLGAGRLFVESLERPGLVVEWPGLVYSRLCGSGERFEVPRGGVLVFGDVAMLADERDEVEALSNLVREGLPTHRSAIDRLSVGAPPYWIGDQEWVMRVLSGPDRGSILFIDPHHLEEPIRIGRAGSPDLHVELPERVGALVEISMKGPSPRLRNRDRSSIVTVNWDEVRPGSFTDLVSGDRITIGRTLLAFEQVPLQSAIERLALYVGDEELPLSRAVNTVGYRPENDVRIVDHRLGARHGIFGVREGGRCYYRHLHADAPARLGNQLIEAGTEVPLQLDETIVLAPGVEVRVGERTTLSWMLDPFGSGPDPFR